MNRTERDLLWLVNNVLSKRIVCGLPERLEALAAWIRHVKEAERLVLGEPSDFVNARNALNIAVSRLVSVGVSPGTGEFTFSPWCGLDL